MEVPGQLFRVRVEGKEAREGVVGECSEEQVLVLSAEPSRGAKARRRPLGGAAGDRSGEVSLPQLGSPFWSF